MFKFVILLAAFMAVASAGHLHAESAILSADPWTYSTLGDANLGLSPPILGSVPLTYSAPTIIVKSPEWDLHSAPVLTHSSVKIIKPLSLSSAW